MSNSTLAKMGIIDCEFKPGRSSEFARKESASDGTEVSGVSLPDAKECDEDDSGGDLLVNGVSDVEEGVEGEGYGGASGDSALVLLLLDNSGRKGFVPLGDPSRSKVGVERAALRKPRPISPGDAGRAKLSSCCSTFHTRIHRCFQTSSERRGPGSSSSLSSPSSVGVVDGLRGFDTRYKTIPVVLGSAYSRAIAHSWACSVG